VASWKVVPRKTDGAMVRTARLRAWSWVTSSTLVNRWRGCERYRQRVLHNLTQRAAKMGMRVVPAEVVA
jgi:hypothetical protein